MNRNYFSFVCVPFLWGCCQHHDSTPRQLFIQDSFKPEQFYCLQWSVEHMSYSIFTSHTQTHGLYHCCLHMLFAVSCTARLLCQVIMECLFAGFCSKGLVQMCYYVFSLTLTVHIVTHTFRSPVPLHPLRAGCGIWGRGGPCWWRGVRRSWAKRRARGRPMTTPPHTHCLHVPHR